MVLPPALPATRARNGSLQGFPDATGGSAHASIQNHFHHDRHLSRRDGFKAKRSAALAEWRELAA